MRKKPILALTIGDPAGIGPEIALRAAALPELQDLCRLVLIGDACVVEAVRPITKVEDPIRIVPWADRSALLATEARGGQIELLDLGLLAEPVPLGIPGEMGGAASYEYLGRAIWELAQVGIVDGIVTGPINKLSWNLAGVRSPGHTEVLAEMTQSNPVAMMMYSERMAVGLVTCHQSLATVPASLTTENIVAVGMLLHKSVGRIRGAMPRIAVLGLNPHAGESGLFGLEETRIIGPAVQQLRAAGIDAEGPLPPDTAFTAKSLARHSVFLCMYHDQGLIPFKMVSFEDGVNVTMGLPFVRTSVDHGTAYEIAGRGIAEIGSLIAAVKLAARLTNGSS